MFGFGKKDKNTVPAAPVAPVATPHNDSRFGAAAPGTKIRFDGALIPKFHREHQELINLYTQTATALNAGDYPGVRHNLMAFNDALRAHLLDENLRFYVYMQYIFKGDPDNEEIIRGFRQEMSQIGKVVYEFLSRYTVRDLTAGEVMEFKAEFDTIGGVLTRRIKAEEERLYPLYQSPETYGY